MQERRPNQGEVAGADGETSGLDGEVLGKRRKDIQADVRSGEVRSRGSSHVNKTGALILLRVEGVEVEGWFGGSGRCVGQMSDRGPGVQAVPASRSIEENGEREGLEEVQNFERGLSRRAGGWGRSGLSLSVASLCVEDMHQGAGDGFKHLLSCGKIVTPFPEPSLSPHPGHHVGEDHGSGIEGCRGGKEGHGGEVDTKNIGIGRKEVSVHSGGVCSKFSPSVQFAGDENNFDLGGRAEEGVDMGCETKVEYRARNGPAMRVIYTNIGPNDDTDKEEEVDGTNCVGGSGSRTEVMFGSVSINWNPETVAALSIFVHGMSLSEPEQPPCSPTTPSSQAKADPPRPQVVPGVVEAVKRVKLEERFEAEGVVNHTQLEKKVENALRPGGGSGARLGKGSSIVVVRAGRLQVWLNKEIVGRRLAVLDAMESRVELRNDWPSGKVSYSGSFASATLTDLATENSAWPTLVSPRPETSLESDSEPQKGKKLRLSSGSIPNFGSGLRSEGDGRVGSMDGDRHSSPSTTSLAPVLRFCMVKEYLNSNLLVELPNYRLVYLNQVWLQVIDYFLSACIGDGPWRPWLLSSPIAGTSETSNISGVCDGDDIDMTDRMRLRVVLELPDVVLPAGHTSKDWVSIAGHKIEAENSFQNRPVGMGKESRMEMCHIWSIHGAGLEFASNLSRTWSSKTATTTSPNQPLTPLSDLVATPLKGRVEVEAAARTGPVLKAFPEVGEASAAPEPTSLDLEAYWCSIPGRARLEDFTYMIIGNILSVSVELPQEDYIIACQVMSNNIAGEVPHQVEGWMDPCHPCHGLNRRQLVEFPYEKANKVATSFDVTLSFHNLIVTALNKTVTDVSSTPLKSNSQSGKVPRSSFSSPSKPVVATSFGGISEDKIGRADSDSVANKCAFSVNPGNQSTSSVGKLSLERCRYADATFAPLGSISADLLKWKMTRCKNWRNCMSIDLEHPLMTQAVAGRGSRILLGDSLDLGQTFGDNNDPDPVKRLDLYHCLHSHYQNQHQGRVRSHQDSIAELRTKEMVGCKSRHSFSWERHRWPDGGKVDNLEIRGGAIRYCPSGWEAWNTWASTKGDNHTTDDSNGKLDHQHKGVLDGEQMKPMTRDEGQDADRSETSISDHSYMVNVVLEDVSVVLQPQDPKGAAGMDKYENVCRDGSNLCEDSGTSVALRASMSLRLTTPFFMEEHSVMKAVTKSMSLLPTAADPAATLIGCNVSCLEVFSLAELPHSQGWERSNTCTWRKVLGRTAGQILYVSSNGLRRDPILSQGGKNGHDGKEEELGSRGICSVTCQGWAPVKLVLRPSDLSAVSTTLRDMEKPTANTTNNGERHIRELHKRVEDKSKDIGAEYGCGEVSEVIPLEVSLSGESLTLILEDDSELHFVKPPSRCGGHSNRDQPSVTDDSLPSQGEVEMGPIGVVDKMVDEKDDGGAWQPREGTGDRKRVRNTTGRTSTETTDNELGKVPSRHSQEVVMVQAGKWGFELSQGNKTYHGENRKGKNGEKRSREVTSAVCWLSTLRVVDLLQSSPGRTPFHELLVVSPRKEGVTQEDLLHREMDEVARARSGEEGGGVSGIGTVPTTADGVTFVANDQSTFAMKVDFSRTISHKLLFPHFEAEHGPLQHHDQDHERNRHMNSKGSISFSSSEISVALGQIQLNWNPSTVAALWSLNVALLSACQPCKMSSQQDKANEKERTNYPSQNDNGVKQGLEHALRLHVEARDGVELRLNKEREGTCLLNAIASSLTLSVDNERCSWGKGKTVWSGSLSGFGAMDPCLSNIHFREVVGPIPNVASSEPGEETSHPDGGKSVSLFFTYNKTWGIGSSPCSVQSEGRDHRNAQEESLCSMLCEGKEGASSEDEWKGNVHCVPWETSSLFLSVSQCRVVYVQPLWLEVVDYLWEGLLGEAVWGIWPEDWNNDVSTPSCANGVEVDTGGSGGRATPDLLRSVSMIEISITSPVVALPGSLSARKHIRLEPRLLQYRTWTGGANDRTSPPAIENCSENGPEARHMCLNIPQIHLFFDDGSPRKRGMRFEGPPDSPRPSPPYSSDMLLLPHEKHEVLLGKETTISISSPMESYGAGSSPYDVGMTEIKEMRKDSPVSSMFLEVEHQTTSSTTRVPAVEGKTLDAELNVRKAHSDLGSEGRWTSATYLKEPVDLLLEVRRLNTLGVKSGTSLTEPSCEKIEDCATEPRCGSGGTVVDVVDIQVKGEKHESSVHWRKGDASGSDGSGSGSGKAGEYIDSSPVNDGGEMSECSSPEESSSDLDLPQDQKMELCLSLPKLKLQVTPASLEALLSVVGGNNILAAGFHGKASDSFPLRDLDKWLGLDAQGRSGVKAWNRSGTTGLSDGFGMETGERTSSIPFSPLVSPHNGAAESCASCSSCGKAFSDIVAQHRCGACANFVCRPCLHTKVQGHPPAMKSRTTSNRAGLNVFLVCDPCAACAFPSLSVNKHHMIRFKYGDDGVTTPLRLNLQLPGLEVDLLKVLDHGGSIGDDFDYILRVETGELGLVLDRAMDRCGSLEMSLESLRVKDNTSGLAFPYVLSPGGPDSSHNDGERESPMSVVSYHFSPGGKSSAQVVVNHLEVLLVPSTLHHLLNFLEAKGVESNKKDHHRIAKESSGNIRTKRGWKVM
ncbi:unnamed protein product [Choristocarpus tenellus]